MYIKAQGSTIIEFPYSIAQLKKDNPNTSFPIRPTEDLLNSFDVKSVLPGEMPEYNSLTQRIEQDTPAYDQENQLWYQNWKVINLSEEEIAINIKNKRQNAFLTRMEFMLALEEAGLYDEVENAMLSDDVDKKTKIMWNNASQFERMHPNLISLGHTLGHTDEQMDDIFGLTLGFTNE